MNRILNTNTAFQHLGLKDFQSAWDYQVKLFNDIIAVKVANRALPEERQVPTENYLLFVEHPHVYTLGKSGNPANLLLSEEALAAIGAAYFPINRGGDITYHGPGQLVGYPILDLENFFTDIHRYMRVLEEAVIRTLAHFDMVAGRIPGLTGVWIEPDTPRARKICAMGVKSSRWVTMHGFALNVNTDLRFFDHIIPCGIKDKAVTSMAEELGSPQDMGRVETVLRSEIAEGFGMTIVSGRPAEG